MADELRSAIDMVAIWKPFAALILTSLALMGSPGPATLSLAAMGAAFGGRQAIPYLMGIVVGTTIVLIAVATGLTGVILAVPRLGPALIGFAALYILYLAYKIATAPPLSTQGSRGSPPSFAGGLLLAVANPKAYAAIAAVLAGVSLVDQHPAIDATLKTCVLAVMIGVINTTWLAVGTVLSRLFHDPVKSRILNVAFAITLIFAMLITLLS